ncbi:hypothetical protein DM01DRAFT_1367632 [Hesseltinella vesiculosa]|uniref:Opi1-domain-containing protein n=1 Tax=Hesseltinella vesiculosa TaxID=101127 RepID=A0A1X2GE42_9FUNG|nr:hypothetical protein DM01DRAFT_1367632 [Hesseltinella vesiculosa]
MTETHTLMSITQLINEEPPNHDKDIQIAAQALGSLAGSYQHHDKITLPPLAAPSTPSSPGVSDVPRFSFSSDVSSYTMDDNSTITSSSSTSLSQQDSHLLSAGSRRYSQSTVSPLMHRVSNIPFVNSALRAYEQSNVARYGADMVGSIYDHFGKSATTDPEQEDDTMAAVHALARTTLSDDLDNASLRRRRLHPDEERKIRSRPHSRSTSPNRPYGSPRLHHHGSSHLQHRSASNKSKWHQIVMHAGSTAAVVSEESMKCLRYCLQWLEYAKKHIQQQMQVLRAFLVSLATSKHSDQQQRTVASHQNSADTLNNIQKEIVTTLRKVVDVISRYAGAGLPSHAKANVRSFILQLPSRWATLNTQPEPCASIDPASDPNNVQEHVRESSAKLLNFGGESIEMLDSVSSVFSDSIYRAEVWLDRLNVIGVSPASRRSSLHTINPNPAPADPHLKPMDIDCN